MSKDFEYVSLTLADGSTIVGIMNGMEEECVKMVKPYYFMIDYYDDGRPFISFRKVNEFSEDEVYLINGYHVLSVNNLGEKYKGVYDNIVSGEYDKEDSDPEEISTTSEMLH